MSNGTPKPESQPLFHEEVSAEIRVQPELEATLLRFWEMVRKSADVIVTLRQENASLQSKLQQARTAPEQPLEELQQLRDALTDSEAEVHALREDLAALPTLRDEVGEMRTLTVTMSAEIERLEKLEGVVDKLRTNEQELLDKLIGAQAELEEMRRTIDRVEDEVRSDKLEVRSQVTSDELEVTSDGVEDEVRSEKLEVTSQVRSEKLEVTSQVRSEKLEVSSVASGDVATQAEVAELTLQLIQMRVELESRTQALQELRVVMLMEHQSRQSDHAESQADVEQVILEREALRARVDELDVVAQRYAEAQDRIAELEESHSELKAELERTMAVVNKYRAAGVAYLEDPSMEGQVPLFGMAAGSKAVTPYMTEEEAKALADRIDLVAQKLAELL